MIIFAENGDNTKTYYHPDLRYIALNETHLIDQPGDYFLYNNYHPLLLGIILERATGIPVAEYLESRIWVPMGTEFSGSWSLDESGFEKMESGINARAIDFAKFGRLFLNKGNWDGKQLISDDWVVESIAENPKFRESAYYGTDFGHDIFEVAEGGYYTYMWYGLYRDNQENDFFAEGRYGQIIYVSPAANLIIVRNGEQYGPDVGVFGWVEIFYQVATEMMQYS